ncbi:MAG: cupin domain-containing protein [Paracoccaceae bacterium]|nr:cupin domain-containing protein [Paracoccaceae bacterium]
MPADPTGHAIDIGQRLRAARTARGLSQRELARQAGVTNGLISQIEQNRSSPSVASLKRILDAMPLSLSEFFSHGETDRKRIFFRAEDLLELNPKRILRRPGAAGQVSLRQVGDGAGRTVQMLYESYEPGSDTGVEHYTHMGEEAGIVISGRIEVTVGDETAELGPGDAYLFESNIPHRFRNLSDEVCILISACSPPSF